MTRSDVAELVGAAGVLLGLVFVAYELRQNTRIQRITATQTLSANYAGALDVLAGEGEAACIYVRGINDLSLLDDAERLRFFVMLFQIYRAGEQLHFYAREGMVEPRIWRGFERQLADVTSLPGVQQWWPLRRDWFSDEFQAFVDSLIATSADRNPQMYRDHACAAQGIPA